MHTSVPEKGNDHIIDAVRCAVLSREHANLDEALEAPIIEKAEVPAWIIALART